METKTDPQPEAEAGTPFGASNVRIYPPAPDRFEMGDKRRFHWREYNGGKYEVYSIGLQQWAECLSEERAKTVADALELFYANVRSHPRLPVARSMPGEERAQAWSVTRVAVGWTALFALILPSFPRNRVSS